jgi:hypothetical protein
VSLVAAGPVTADARKKPSQAKLAKKLVKGVSKARTPKARSKAVLKLMRALDIAVMTRNGKPLVVTPEPNSARTFQLYDFELRALGTQYARGDTVTIADVARNLSKSGITLDEEGTKELPPKLLHAGLQSAVRQARRKRRHQRSLLPLVVRELGLRQGYDLARKTPESKVKLDALQAWLVSADVTIGVLRKIPEPRTASRAATGAGASQACDRFNKAVEDFEKKIEDKLQGKVQAWIAKKGVGKIVDKISEKLGSKVTRWGIETLPRWAVRGVWKTVKSANVAKQAAGALHGVLLAYSIRVTEATDGTETHYGHDGPGNQIVFKVFVESLDDYGEFAATCGKLAGVELPRSGPIANVPVLWEAPEGKLAPDHGKLDCGFAVCTSTTGMDGIAKLTFTPRVELVPDIGIEKSDTGVVNGIALYQSALGAGVIGEVAQFIFPKWAGSRWLVTYHRPNGYRVQWTSTRKCFTAPEDPCTDTLGNELEVRYDVRVCGSDPYARWTGTMQDWSFINRDYDPSPPEPIEFSLARGESSTVFYGLGEDSYGRSVFTLVEGAEPHMRIDTYRPSFLGPVYEDSVAARISENTDCPEQ